jgi:hypothetical protein
VTEPAAPMAAPREYEDIDAAAARLATTPVALRARCRRGARREGKHVVAHLGPGIMAWKMGRAWRVRFSHGSA